MSALFGTLGGSDLLSQPSLPASVFGIEIQFPGFMY